MLFKGLALMRWQGSCMAGFDRRATGAREPIP